MQALIGTHDDSGHGGVESRPKSLPVDWPKDSVIETDGRYDWVNSIDQMEDWLDVSVGRRLVAWAWTCMDTPCHSACAVAFKLDRDRSMFLLRWGS